MGGAVWDFVSPGLTEHIRPLKDASPYNTPAHLMGNAKVKKGVQKGDDKMQFYLHSGLMHRLDVDLPDNWIGKWHHVTASWDGKEMKLFIDGQLKGTESTVAKSDERPNRWGGNQPKERGMLSNFPYPINIGRIAGNHAIDPATIYTADAEMDNVAIYNKCLADGEGRAEDAVLYLTFDSNSDEGIFYTIGGNMRTYGTIWPDRTVQPEMVQMKWTTQPVSIRLLNAETGEAEVTNRLYFTDLRQYASHWQLMEDGNVLDEGDILLSAGPQQKQVIRIPYHKPTIVPGKEYRITITSALKNNELWAKAGHEVAWDQLELTSWNIPTTTVPATSPTTVPDASPATVPDASPSGTLTTVPDASASVKTEEDANQVKISGNGFCYTISKQTGNLEQIEVAGKNILKEPLSFNLWRAPIANEFDAWASYREAGAHVEGYGDMIASIFYSKGLNQLKIRPDKVELIHNAHETTVKVHQLVQVGASSFGTLDLYIQGVQLAGYSLDYTYTFYDDGTVKIHNHMSPQGKLPELLPRIGFTTSVNKEFDNITWYGRGPEENYPDRKTGYKVGVWTKNVADMYEPYLLPQDHALRTDNRYIQLVNNEGTGVQIAMNEHFNFNAYQFSTDNLTKSQFTYQLQPQPDRYTLNLDYATTGVGCSCVYVLDEYRLRPTTFDREIELKVLK